MDRIGLMARAVSILSSIALVLFAQSAHAEDAKPVALTFLAPTDDARCPDALSFRNLVAARLGYDPFDASAPDAVHVEIAREKGALRGSAEIVRDGNATSARKITAPADQCDALAAALSTTIAIALDPVRAAGGKPAPASSSTTEATTPPAATKPEPSKPEPPSGTKPSATTSEGKEKAPLVFYGLLGGVITVAEAPTTTLGGELGVGLRVASFSIEASARVATTPVPVRVDSGDRLQATLVSGALAPCAHFGGWGGCLVGRVGAFQGFAPDVKDAALGTSVFATVGARVEYSFELNRTFSFRPSLEAALALARTSLVIDDRSVWTAPAVTAAGTIALIANFR